MARFGKVSFGIAVTLASALLVNGQPASAEGIKLKDSVHSTPAARCVESRASLGNIVVASAKRKGERKVRVDVEKAVSIAIGEGASARMHIADNIAQPTGALTRTVRVGTISHTVLGPKASSCIVLPFAELEDSKVGQDDAGTAWDK